jgi:hypothetical protein
MLVLFEMMEVTSSLEWKMYVATRVAINVRSRTNPFPRVVWKYLVSATFSPRPSLLD